MLAAQFKPARRDDRADTLCTRFRIDGNDAVSGEFFELAVVSVKMTVAKFCTKARAEWHDGSDGQEASS